MAKGKSRPQRWADASARAVTALEELVEMQSEYQEWYDNMPENTQSSPTGEKLSTVTELDLQSALDTVQEADGVELPLGYGKD